MDSILLHQGGLPSHIMSHVSDQLNIPNQYADVTLVCCQDGVATRLHRLVLSTASPALHQLLLDTTHPDPVILLDGVTQEQLQPLLTIMYRGLEPGKVSLETRSLAALLGINLELDKLEKKNKGRVEVDKEDMAGQLDASATTANYLEEDDVCAVKSEGLQDTGNLVKEEMDIEFENDSDAEYIKSLDENLDLDHFEPEDEESESALQKSKARFSDPSDEDIIKCHECNIVYKTSENLRKHNKLKHNADAEVYNCNPCGFTTYIKDSYAKHMKRYHDVHDVYQMKCHRCDRTFTSKRDKTVHMQTDHKDEPYKCDHCDYTANYKYVVKRHALTKHGGAPKNICSECGKKFHEKSRLDFHVREIHEKIRFHCDQCEYTTTRKLTLNEHIKVKHEGATPKSYPCDQCEKVFAGSFYLNIHIQSVHEGKKYFCEQCGFTASNPYTLREHTISIHEGNLFECTQCDHKYTTKSGLRYHVKVFHEGGTFPCTLCDFVAKAQTSLRYHVKKKHELMNIEQKKYNCDQCEYKTLSKKRFRRHQELRHSRTAAQIVYNSNQMVHP